MLTNSFEQYNFDLCVYFVNDTYGELTSVRITRLAHSPEVSAFEAIEWSMD